MPTRTVEIEDTLKERTDGAIEEVKDAMMEWLDENPDADEAPCLNNDLDYSGRIHEIVDGSVPIYTKEIEDTWYLHTDLLESAYEDAGVGENPRDNNGMAAIYYHISESVGQWYDQRKDELFEEWHTEHHCVRCDSFLKDGQCQDETCPFSDCEQDDKAGWAGHPEKDCGE